MRRASRRSATFQALTRDPKCLGAGIFCSLTQRQTVARETPNSATTAGRRTWAESGSVSNSRRETSEASVRPSACGGLATWASLQWINGFFCIQV